MAGNNIIFVLHFYVRLNILVLMRHLIPKNLLQSGKKKRLSPNFLTYVTHNNGCLRKMTKLLMMDLLSLPSQNTEIFPCVKLLSHLFPVRETSITFSPTNVSRNAIYAMLLKLNPKKLETLPSALYCRKLQPVLC